MWCWLLAFLMMAAKYSALLPALPLWLCLAPVGLWGVVIVVVIVLKALQEALT